MLRLPTLQQLDQSSSLRIFLCAQPTDMRRGFDRLAEMVQAFCRQDPLSGHLFVFRSRNSDRLKILYWDRDGYCIWYGSTEVAEINGLEEGTFRFPHRRGAHGRDISYGKGVDKHQTSC